jgi:UTP--glucose-1-phosphate uridylyltransferase
MENRTPTKPKMARDGIALFPLIEILKEPIFESLFILEGTMTGVSHGIIVAGGIGSRMFPASAYVPKEMLPLVDIPAMLHLIFEAKLAGVEVLHIVTSPNKNLEAIVDATAMKQYRGKMDEQLFDACNGIEVQFHVQHQPKGFGDALMQALPFVDGACLVLLGDNILLDRHTSTEDFQPSTASMQLVNTFVKTNEPTVALFPVKPEEIGHYGIAKVEGGKVIEIIEKPSQQDAPSNLALCGRYIFTQDAMELLQKYSYEEFGELQTIEMQKRWMEEGRLHGHLFDQMAWYDSGLPLAWLKSQIDHGLRRADYKDDLLEWLRERIG